MPSSVLHVYLVSKQTTLSILLRILIPDTRLTKPENFTEILRNIVRMREQIVPGRFFLPRKKWPGNEAIVIVGGVGLRMRVRPTWPTPPWVDMNIIMFASAIPPMKIHDHK